MNKQHETLGGDQDFERLRSEISATRDAQPDGSKMGLCYDLAQNPEFGQAVIDRAYHGVGRRYGLLATLACQLCAITDTCSYNVNNTRRKKSV